MKTEAIIFPEADTITFGEVELPEPEPGDAVVRTTHTVLSTGTDTRTLLGGQTGGSFPLVPSYSALGIVEETYGETGHVQEGDLVFSGGPKGLVGITRCWGAQVARCVKPASELLKLDDRRPAQEYVFSKVAGIALHGVRRTLTEPGDRVVVVGQGLIGQLHARIQAAFGRRVIATDIIPWRLERSRAGGALLTINAREEDVERAVRGVWPEGAQVAIEASARQAGIEQCVALLRERQWGGDDRMPVLMLQGSYPETIRLDPLTIFRKEFWVVNSRDTDPRDLVGAACMIGARGLDVSDLITLKAKPQDADQAFREVLEHPERHFTCVFEWE